MGIGFGETLEFISLFAETDMTAVQVGLRNSQQCNAMNRYEQNMSVGMSFFLPQKSSKYVHFLVFAMTMSTRGGFGQTDCCPDHSFVVIAPAQIFSSNTSNSKLPVLHGSMGVSCVHFAISQGSCPTLIIFRAPSTCLVQQAGLCSWPKGTPW